MNSGERLHFLKPCQSCLDQQTTPLSEIAAADSPGEYVGNVRDIGLVLDNVVVQCEGRL